MSKYEGNSSGGLGLGSVLTIIFVVLKLVDVINWSWWWVFSPILIEIGLSLILLVGFTIYILYEDKRDGITYEKEKRDKWKF